MKPSIGIFDSGLGGLSVWREIWKGLPQASIIYAADSANCPYGDKSPTWVRDRSEVITRFLLEQNCQVIVIACNTATAHAIQHLRAQFGIDFVGLEPAIKPAALNSQNASIGVLATKNTLRGNHYLNTKAKYTQGIQVWEAIGQGLVELVENGVFEGEAAEGLLKKYLDPMLEKNIDQLVLGCTHYPFLIPGIKKVIPDKVNIVDPAKAVARRVAQVWKSRGRVESEGFSHYQFYTNASDQTLRQLIRSMAPKLEYRLDSQMLRG